MKEIDLNLWVDNARPWLKSGELNNVVVLMFCLDVKVGEHCSNGTKKWEAACKKTTRFQVQWNSAHSFYEKITELVSRTEDHFMSSNLLYIP